MEKLGIHPVLIVTQIINFLIVFFLLKKLLYKPILDMLDKRKQKVLATDELQVQLTREKEHMAEEKAKLLKQGQEEAQQIIARAHDSGEKITAQMKHEAGQQAKNIITEAQVQMAAEEKRMKESLKQQVAEVALRTSEAVLSETLSPEQREKINREAIQRFNPHE